MDKRTGDLCDRFLMFGAQIIKLSRKLNLDFIEKHIALQLTRSGTSCGANYSEGCGAESRKDFIHKLKVVLKELNETMYWLKLIVSAEIQEEKAVGPLVQEAGELSNVIARSLITAQGSK